MMLLKVTIAINLRILTLTQSNIAVRNILGDMKNRLFISSEFPYSFYSNVPLHIEYNSTNFLWLNVIIYLDYNILQGITIKETRTSGWCYKKTRMQHSHYIGSIFYVIAIRSTNHLMTRPIDNKYLIFTQTALNHLYVSFIIDSPTWSCACVFVSLNPSRYVSGYRSRCNQFYNRSFYAHVCSFHWFCRIEL